MPRPRPRYVWAPLAALAAGLAAGCFGGSQNPGSFPWFLPTGDIVRTHAKPPGRGYFSDFDRRACRLEVRPTETCVHVRGSQVLIATVYDEDGQPRRKRRVEWIVEGPGNIIEVDESGFLPGRGYKVDNKYAVSYTDYLEHTITRGNDDPRDDFVIRPGQSWAVISSAVEGKTTVTVYAPEIHDWDRGRVFVKMHFVDAEWQFPQPVTVRAGTGHSLTTKVQRHTDRQPLSGYRVRYRLVDGPPAAVFAGAAQLSGDPQEAVAVTDADGVARVNVRQPQPKFGVNRVVVEVLQPDGEGNSGFTVVGRSETKVDWQGPQVAVTVVAPKVAQLNQDLPVTFTVASTGPVDAQPMMLKAKVPPGLELVSSSEKATRDGDAALWALPPSLGAGKQHAIQAVFRPTRLGSASIAATVPTADGQRFEESAEVRVAEAKLQMTLSGPAAAVAGETLPLQLTIANPGSGPATNVQVTARYDDGLSLAMKNDPLEPRLPTIAAGQTTTVPLQVIATKSGRLSIRATAVGDGNVSAQAQPYQVQVAEPKLTVQVFGPTRSFLDQEVTWRLLVRNPSDVALSNVVLRAELPGEVEFRKASRDGKLTRDQVVVWDLGSAPGKQEVEVEVTGVPTRLADRAVLTADVTADPLVSRDGQFRQASMSRPFAAEKPAEASLEILGIPALQMEVSESNDPIEVGKKMAYTIRVRNAGSLAGSKVQVLAELPQGLKPLRAYGPVGGTVDGQRVTFPTIDGIQPGKAAYFTIEAEAVSSGDGKLRAELRAMPLGAPIRIEEPTRILPRATFGPVPQPKR